MIHIPILVLLIPCCLSDPLRIKVVKDISRVNGRARSLGVFNESLTSDITFYKGPILVGTPPVEYIMNFDTGSPTTWLASADCVYDNLTPCSSQIHRYDNKTSSTSKTNGETFSLTYGTGHTKGIYCTDKVAIGTEKEHGDKFFDLKLGVASKLGDFFAHNRDDGLVGLSPITPGAEDISFVNCAYKSGVFSKPIFTFWMNTKDYDRGTRSAEIIFGEEDPSRCEPVSVYVQSDIEYGHWMFHVDEIKINGQTVVTNAYAVSDTGSTDLVVPATFRDQIAPFLSTKVLSCDSFNGMEIEFVIGGQSFKVGGKELMLDVGEACQSGVSVFSQRIVPGRDVWLLGDVFIRSHCQTYDFAENRIGFAKAKQI